MNGLTVFFSQCGSCTLALFFSQTTAITSASHLVGQIELQVRDRVDYYMPLLAFLETRVPPLDFPPHFKEAIAWADIVPIGFIIAFD